MDDPNITMEEYIRLEEEKARRRGKVYNWETATYGKLRDDEDVHDLRSVETEFPAIVFNDAFTSEVTSSYEPTVSPLNDNKIDFRISFDESDDEDYTVIFYENSFSYKIIFVSDLITDSKNDNDKVNMPSFPSPELTVSYFDDLDFFKDLEKEFPAIVYNDALTSKLEHIEEEGKFLKELHDNTFSGSEQEDANEHIEKVLEIVDLFHILKVTQDQIMLRAFLVSLTGAASRWLRNQPSGSITTWEVLKTKFLNKCCPPARTTNKMQKINNFQQEPDEILFRAWERFKELLMKCPQHYLTDMQESTKTSDGLLYPSTTHQSPREIKRYNEKVYAAQVGCELCKGPHYIKDCPQKEEHKTLKEAYYTHFGAPYQPGGQYRAAGPGFYQRNNGNSLYPARRETMEESLTKFMAESAKRHEENSNIIKEI
ncbi:gypsy/ty3 retroelement polyprotein [Tanacetum coccineum]